MEIHKLFSWFILADDLQKPFSNLFRKKLLWIAFQKASHWNYLDLINFPSVHDESKSVEEVIPCVHVIFLFPCAWVLVV